MAKTNALQSQIKIAEEEKTQLKKQLSEAEEKLNVPNSGTQTATNNQVSGTVNSIGLSTLSLFRPIQDQHDRSRPASLNLSGFKVVSNRDTTNLQFNIIPAIGGEGKLAGHIIVIMKNELGISVYPQTALSGPETQINYFSGEPFATQRFRPVDASFLKPRKAGNYTFTVYIFAKNGDLLHFQSLVLQVKI